MTPRAVARMKKIPPSLLAGLAIIVLLVGWALANNVGSEKVETATESTKAEEPAMLVDGVEYPYQSEAELQAAFDTTVAVLEWEYGDSIWAMWHEVLSGHCIPLGQGTLSAAEVMRGMESRYGLMADQARDMLVTSVYQKCPEHRATLAPALGIGVPTRTAAPAAPAEFPSAEPSDTGGPTNLNNINMDALTATIASEAGVESSAVDCPSLTEAATGTGESFDCSVSLDGRGMYFAWVTVTETAPYYTFVFGGAG